MPAPVVGEGLAVALAEPGEQAPLPGPVRQLPARAPKRVPVAEPALVVALVSAGGPGAERVVPAAADGARAGSAVARRR